MLKKSLHKELDEIEVPTAEVLERIRQGIKDGRKVKLRKKRTLYLLICASITAAATIFLTAQNDFFSQKEEKKSLPIAIKQTPSIVKLDVNMARLDIQQKGFLVSQTDLPVRNGIGGESLTNFDISYNPTLKDQVFNTDIIVKGKVIGIRSFIKDEHMVMSEVKLLVEEGLSGKMQPGDIYTFVTPGGVITEYDFWKINGNKYNLSEKQLEEAKKKRIVENIFGTLAYPDDELYLFVRKDAFTVSTSNEELPVGGFQIRLIDGKIEPANNYETQSLDYLKELSAMKSPLELHSALTKYAIEKKDYSESKARSVAYDALSNNQQRTVTDKKSATVFYMTNGTFIEGLKSEPNLIKVSFPCIESQNITVYIREKNLEVYKITK